MAIDKIIVDFAQTLYSKIDATGKRVHSFRSISNLIQTKFNKKINYSTISLWPKKFNWNEKNDKIKQVAIETALPVDEIQSHQDLIFDVVKDYKNAAVLANIGYDALMKNHKKQPTNLTVKDAMNAIKIGTEIKNKLRGVTDPGGKSELEPITWNLGKDRIMTF